MDRTLPAIICWSREGLVEATGYTEEELWKQMSLDDWDYAIVCYKDDYKSFENGWVSLERLLTGVCDNEIYELPCKDKPRTMLVGMAYHA